MPSLVKRSGKYYVRIRTAGCDKLIPTNERTKAAAQHVADRISIELSRSHLSESLTQILITYAYREAEAHFASTVRNPDTGKAGRFRALQQELYAAAELQAIPLLELLAPSAPIRAAELWAHYVATAGNQIKPITLKTKSHRFAKFSRWAKERDLRDLSVDDAARFLAQLNSKKQTRNNYISDLSSVFKSHSQIKNPWTAALRVSVDDAKETPPIALDMIRAILQFCDNNPEAEARKIKLLRWTYFLRTLYYTGLRPVDVCHFSAAALMNGTIDLEPIKTSRTKKRISFTADRKLIKLLSPLKPNSNGLFFPEFAAAYDRDRSNVQKGFLQICKMANLPNLQLYGFRHQFMTYQIDAGVDDQDLAAAVGHSSTTTTKKHYYHGKRNVSLAELPEI